MKITELAKKNPVLTVVLFEPFVEIMSNNLMSSEHTHDNDDEKKNAHSHRRRCHKKYLFNGKPKAQSIIIKTITVPANDLSSSFSVTICSSNLINEGFFIINCIDRSCVYIFCVCLNENTRKQFFPLSSLPKMYLLLSLIYPLN